MRIATRAAVVLITLFGGCTGPEDESDAHLVIRTDRAQYAMSDRDQIRLTAQIPPQLPVYVYRYSAFLLLNRWDGTEWQRLPVWYSTPPADAELTGFTDGDRDSWARASIVPDLEQVLTVPGRYRFELLWYTSPAPVSLFPEVERTSNPFEIAS